MKIKCTESGCKQMFLPFDDEGNLRLICPNCTKRTDKEVGDK
jgi:hypothetical protein